MANQLRASYEQGVIRTPVSTNMLMELEKFSATEELGYGYAMENFLNKFHAEERPAVKTVMENWSQKIMEDLFDFIEVDDDDPNAEEVTFYEDEVGEE
jgi:hypothetical protein